MRSIGKIVISIIVFLTGTITWAQTSDNVEGIRVGASIYKGDTIPSLRIPNVIIFPEIKFKNEKQRREYDKLVRDVKRTLPFAKIINQTILETYEYLETLPDKKAKDQHIKRVEKGLKEQYTPMMKKLTFAQGKMLIKLVDRECNQSSYELVKAFMGPFKAGFYQTFAAVFGASLKKEYKPDGNDQMIERIVILVENGQL